MGIRLSSSIKANASSGLKLVFKEGFTYDLDQLVSMRNRADGTTRLLIQVKYDKDISREVMNKLKSDIALQIDTDLDNTEVQEGIANIIANNPTDYSAKVNQYLKSLLTKYNLSYFVVQYPGTDYVEITYDFDNNTELTRRFQDYYSKYSTLYKELLENGSEGSLSISDLAETTNVDSSDFAKYLLGKEIKKEIDVHDLEMLYKKIQEVEKKNNSIKISLVVQNTDNEVPTSKAVIDYIYDKFNTITKESEIDENVLVLSNLDDIDEDESTIEFSNVHSMEYDEESDSFGIVLEV